LFSLEGFDYRPNLHTITADTLVISGKYDGLNLPEGGREIAELILQATFMEFEESGHGPNVEEPIRFMEEIINFLQ
jgi:3-oxoadipate enol-lactonase